MAKTNDGPGRANGKTIVDSLTEYQLAALLDVICRPSIIKPLMEKLLETDEDMAETIEKIVLREKGPSSDAGFLETASEMKITQRWDQLRYKWDDIVLKLGDERGPYANQDEPWHSPYFDGYRLSSDIESVAEQMIEMIDDVFALVEDDDLFQDAIDDMDMGILSFPEEMDVENYDGWELGNLASRCALKWAWLASADDDNPGKSFLERVHAMDRTPKTVSLSYSEICTFFATLPDVAGKQVYETFCQDASKYDVDNIHTRWHRIFHNFEQKYDTASYLETCRENLSENWRYGSPLVENAFESENFPEANKYLEHTFSSLLNQKKKWGPEDGLLFAGLRFRYEPGECEITRLLDTWAKVADKLGNPERKAAALFQAGAFRSQEEWDVVFDLKESLSSPEADGVVERLFESWKNEMVARSAGNYRRDLDAENNWVAWLLEARADIEDKGAWFRNMIRGWLASMSKDAQAFEKNARWLSLFTMDAPGSEKLSQKYPVFFHAAIEKAESHKTVLTKSRRKALSELEAGKCLDSAMRVWKERLASMVPSPARNHGSQYREHALWMNALYELALEDYKLVLERWRNKHKRRKNLWRDMEERKLPV